MALRPDNSQNPADELAERKAAQDDVFLREVDDALRQDQMMGLFKRYGWPILGLVVAGLLGLGGYLWWDGQQNNKAAQRGEQFTMALDQIEAGRLDAGDKQLKQLAATGHGGSQAAAALMRGGIALTQKRPDDAARLFAAVAADTSAPQPFRDLATIREVATKFDSMPPAQVVMRLKPLAIPGNAWFGNAGELLGIAYLKQGRNDLAGPLFAAIARDKDAPETLRQRSRQLAGLLGVDAIDDVEKMIGAQAPDAPVPVKQ